MVNDIVNNWIEELLKTNGVESLGDLPVPVVLDELHEVAGNIDNCIAFNDELGLECNKRCFEKLKDLSSYKKPLICPVKRIESENENE